MNCLFSQLYGANAYFSQRKIIVVKRLILSSFPWSDYFAIIEKPLWNLKNGETKRVRIEERIASIYKITAEKYYMRSYTVYKFFWAGFLIL